MKKSLKYQIFKKSLDFYRKINKLLIENRQKYKKKMGCKVLKCKKNYLNESIDYEETGHESAGCLCFLSKLFILYCVVWFIMK